MVERDRYKEFYEASVEIDRLCTTVGPSDAEWRAGRERFAAAADAVERPRAGETP